MNTERHIMTPFMIVFACLVVGLLSVGCETIQSATRAESSDSQDALVRREFDRLARDVHDGKVSMAPQTLSSIDDVMSLFHDVQHQAKGLAEDRAVLMRGFLMKVRNGDKGNDAPSQEDRAEWMNHYLDEELNKLINERIRISKSDW